MIYFIVILLALLFFVSIVPIMQLLIYNMNATDKVEYDFPSELINSDMKELKYENISDSRINREYASLEDRKAKAYSVELP